MSSQDTLNKSCRNLFWKTKIKRTHDRHPGECLRKYQSKDTIYCGKFSVHANKSVMICSVFLNVFYACREFEMTNNFSRICSNTLRFSSCKIISLQITEITTFTILSETKQLHKMALQNQKNTTVFFNHSLDPNKMIILIVST